MTRPQAIIVKDINVAAFIWAVTGQDPEIVFPSGQTLASFKFDRTYAVADALEGYQTGLAVEGKRLLNCRESLWVRLRRSRP